MKAISLSEEDFRRSALNNNFQHLWVYNKFQNQKKIHRNGVSMNRYKGLPSLCIVIEEDRNILDKDLEQLFGKGSFINGGVSPDDKFNSKLNFKSYYITSKNL